MAMLVLNRFLLHIRAAEVSASCYLPNDDDGDDPSYDDVNLDGPEHQPSASGRTVAAAINDDGEERRPQALEIGVTQELEFTMHYAEPSCRGVRTVQWRV